MRSKIPGPHTLDDQVGAEDTHRANADARLGGAVRGTEAGEDDGGGAAHGAKEGLFRSRLVSAFSKTPDCGYSAARAPAVQVVSA